MSSRRLTSARQKPEEALQRACVHVLEHYVPEPPAGPSWTAINPVSAKSRAVAGKSRALGLRKGWPDMHLLHQGRSIFIEFKADKGHVSAEQKAIHAEIKAAGGVVWIARSVEAFLRILDHEGLPCKVSNIGLLLSNIK